MIGVNQRSRATTVVMKTGSPRFSNRIFGLLLYIRGTTKRTPLFTTCTPPIPLHIHPPQLGLAVIKIGFSYLGIGNDRHFDRMTSHMTSSRDMDLT